MVGDEASMRDHGGSKRTKRFKPPPYEQPGAILTGFGANPSESRRRSHLYYPAPSSGQNLDRKQNPSGLGSWVSEPAVTKMSGILIKTDCLRMASFALGDPLRRR